MICVVRMVGKFRGITNNYNNDNGDDYDTEKIIIIAIIIMKVIRIIIKILKIIHKDIDNDQNIVYKKRDINRINNHNDSSCSNTTNNASDNH